MDAAIKRQGPTHVVPWNGLSPTLRTPSNYNSQSAGRTRPPPSGFSIFYNVPYLDYTGVEMLLARLRYGSTWVRCGRVGRIFLRFPPRPRRCHGTPFAVLLLALSLSSDLCVAAQARLTWEAVSDSRVQRYELFFGTDSGAYQDSLETLEPTAVVDGLDSQQLYFFAVRACGPPGGACSDFSEEALGIDGDSNGELEPFCWPCLPRRGGWRMLLE